MIIRIRMLHRIKTMRFKSLIFSVFSVTLMMSVNLSVVAEVEYIELPAVQLEKLSSDDFEVRERGVIAIRKWSEQNLTSSPELLYKAWRQNDDPEAKARCYGVMREMLKIREFGKGKGFLGIQMSGVMLPVKPDGQAGQQAVSVLVVLPNTPAQKVGLRGGDIILRVDKLDLSSADEDFNGKKFGGRQLNQFALSQAVEKFSNYIKSKQPEDKVTLHLLRGDKRVAKEVALMRLDPAIDPNHEKTEEEFEVCLSKWLKQMELGTILK